MSSPAAGLAFNDYKTKTMYCSLRLIRHAGGGQVQRGLGGLAYSN